MLFALATHSATRAGLADKLNRLFFPGLEFGGQVSLAISQNLLFPGSA